MKISDLSKAELSRWIAEKREPFSTLPEATEPILLGERGRPSPLKAWCETSDYETGDVPYWQPRDFVDDHAMTVTILEELGEMWTTVTLSKRGVRLSVRTKRIPLGHKGARYLIKWTQGKHLGRTVAETWALVSGFQEE